MVSSLRIRRLLGLATLTWLAVAMAHGHAATVSWNGGAGASMSWAADGVGGNWSDAARPGPSDDVLFTDVAGGAARGTLTNTVDDDFSVNSLSFQLGSTPAGFFQTTQIAPGKTLLLAGGLNVASFSVGTSAQSQQGKQFPIDVAFLGSGSTLQIGNTGTNTATMVVGRSAGTGTHYLYSSHSYGKLDLSGLDSFVANLNTMVLAHGIDWSNAGLVELNLASNNTIAARTIETGRSTGAVRIYLGQNNTIRADSFSLNIGKGGPSTAPLFGSEMRFRSGLINPVLNLTGLTGAGVDLAIANNYTNATGAVGNDIVDLSGGTFNATIDDLIIGRFNYTNAGGIQGTLIMEAGSVTANTVTMAVTNSTSPTNTKGTLTLRGGSFTVYGDVTDGAGTSTLNVHGGRFRTLGGLQVDSLNLGTTAATAALRLAGPGATAGPRQLGTYTQGANGKLELEFTSTGVGALMANTATLANGSTVEVFSGGLTDSADQTRWVSGTATWDTSAANWDKGLPAGVLVNTNDSFTLLQATTLTNNGLTLVNSPGWSLNVAEGANGQVSVTRTGAATTYRPVRAVIDGSTAAVTRTADLTVAEVAGSDAAMLEVKAGSLTIGAAGANKNLTLGSGPIAGQLLQSGGAITVNGSVLDGGASSVNLNGGTMTVTGNFQVDALALGVGAGSGVLNLTGTGTTHGITGGIQDGGGTSTVNADGGTMTVAGGLAVDSLRVGCLSASGGGAATMTVTSGAVVIGPSGNLDLGRRTVGSTAANTESKLDLRNALSVQINVDNVWLGLQQDYTGKNVGAGMATSGILLLSQNGSNTINANRILLGDVPGGAGASNLTSKITFGRATNTVNTDRFTLGGRKGWGSADILAGGTLNLSGLTDGNDRADLYIGDNDVATNSRSIGLLDMSGGTFNATLDEVFIGRSTIGATDDYGNGTLIMETGVVTANRLRLAETANVNKPERTMATLTLRGGDFTVSGDVTSGAGVTTLTLSGARFTANNILLASGSAAGKATVNLSSGKLTAGTIAKGAGTLTFNFTGGTLAVGDFGMSDGPLDLVQNGGILAPGNSVGLTTIHGDYRLNSGSLDLELDGLAGAGRLGGHDQLIVYGDVVLAGQLDLTLGFAPPMGNSFVLVDNRGANRVTGTFDGLLEQSDVELLFGDETYTFAITYQGGDGNDVVLSIGAVPEPTGLVLLLVGAAFLVGLGRSRRALTGQNA